MSSTQASDEPPHVVDDCRGVLHVLSDGTIVRSLEPLGGTDIPADPSVQWKDVVYDKVLGLRLRMYSPVAAGAGRLPVIAYFHGGGFCIGSYAWPIFHVVCSRLAAVLPAIVVAADYRLAPEHRLPAAVEDGATALLWLASRAAGSDADPLLAEAADFGRVFISGYSAGGTIAHHLAVRFGSAAGRAELEPARVTGCALLMPFFGGVHRTASEAACPEDAFLNLEQNDRYWRLSLPADATADHPVANPFGPHSPSLDSVDFVPTLVVVGGRDLLLDRAADYAARLTAMGKPVELVEFEGQQHGFFTADPWSEHSDELLRVVKRFVESVGRFN